MNECDFPSEATIEKITCTKNKFLMTRVIISPPDLKGFYGGSSLKGIVKGNTIHKERKERSHEDFKKNIFPTLPKQEKKHFEKKWKKQGRD